VRIEPLRTVVDVRPLDPDQPDAGYAVTTERTGAWRRRDRRTVTAGQVVLAAGTWGTQKLLHSLRAAGSLPHLSPRLGELTRTNSESLLGAVTRSVPRDADLAKGVAITSSFHPDDNTHVENVRYGKGSNSMGLLGSLLVDGGGRRPRWARWLGQAARRPDQVARTLWVRHWSERTVIGLVMQSLDNSLTVSARRRPLGGVGLTSRQGHGQPNPTWIPAANVALRRLAARLSERTGLKAYAGSSLGEIADIPMTAHFLGGAVIGDGPGTGVVDAYHRVWGYPGLHVVDGSAVSANLGVNPSLTITAQAERAMSLWPNRGDADPRPAQDEVYAVLAPVRARRPAVPLGFPVRVEPAVSAAAATMGG
jgi:cholesterol oxidase